MGIAYTNYSEVTVLDKVYRNGDYFFDDGTRQIELRELHVTAKQLVQTIAPGQTAKGTVAIDGTIKVPIVFSAWFDSGEPFDIYIRDAKDGALELGILDVVFTSYGPNYVTYAARKFVQFPKPQKGNKRKDENMGKIHNLKSSDIYSVNYAKKYLEIEFRGVEYLQKDISPGDILRITRNTDYNPPNGLGWRDEEKNERSFIVMYATRKEVRDQPHSITCSVKRMVEGIPHEVERKNRLEEMKQMVDLYGKCLPRLPGIPEKSLRIPIVAAANTMSPENFKMPNQNGDSFPPIITFPDYIMERINKAKEADRTFSMGCTVDKPTCSICSENKKEGESPMGLTPEDIEGPEQCKDYVSMLDDAHWALTHLKDSMKRFFSDFEEEFEQFKDVPFPRQVVYAAIAYLERLAAQGLTKQDVVYYPRHKYKPIQIEKKGKRYTRKVMIENDEDYFHNF